MPDKRAGHVDYVPTLFVFTKQSRNGDQMQAQIQERERRHLKRMRTASDCVQINKKRKTKEGQIDEEVNDRGNTEVRSNEVEDSPRQNEDGQSDREVEFCGNSVEVEDEFDDNVPNDKEQESWQCEEAEDGQRLDESGQSDHAAVNRETELSEGNTQYNGEKESSDWLNDEDAEDSQRQDESRQSDCADNRQYNGEQESSDWLNDEEAEDSQRQDESRQSDCADNRQYNGEQESSDWLNDEEAEDSQRQDESRQSDCADNTGLREGDRQYNGEQESSDWLNDEEAEDSQRHDESRQSAEVDDRQSDGDESSDWDEEAEDELDNEEQSTAYLDPSWLSAPKSSVIWIVQENDYATKFYTGLTSWKLFEYVLHFLGKSSPGLVRIHSRSKLLPSECLLLVLMRLRLNLQVEDLSYRFDVAPSTVTEVFDKWIRTMDTCLKFLIMWPSRESVYSNMPQIFRDLYPRTRCIIDCSEIYVVRPYTHLARAQTYSSYKKHNTVKFFIGITPNGAISFLSRCWGGRATDKHITHHSGFLEKIEYGDSILADRGFDIADDLAVHGARLQIPSFMRGKQQLSMHDVEVSKKLAKVRIHVERVIGLLKNKYKILQGTLPIQVLKHKHDTREYANIDRILTVCAALINLCPSVVPL